MINNTPDFTKINTLDRPIQEMLFKSSSYKKCFQNFFKNIFFLFFFPSSLWLQNKGVEENKNCCHKMNSLIYMTQLQLVVEAVQSKPRKHHELKKKAMDNGVMFVHSHASKQHFLNKQASILVNFVATNACGKFCIQGLPF